jgi:hypothetical protein
MRIQNPTVSICAAVAAAFVLALAGSNALADTSSTPVTCKDGSTSPHGGRGACSGHGGIDKAAAPGGGADKVWVNTSSKVYHCPSDVWYGKTKQGQYMSEADAKAKGNKPDHGKPCS